MTITETDIKKLADLSRMKLSPEEMSQFAKEIDSILGYVEQIKEVSDSGAKLDASTRLPSDIPHRNMLREDVEDKTLCSEPAVLVDSAPSSEDGYVKVKKILG